MADIDANAAGAVDALESRLAGDQACIGIIGLGYVGMPLAAAAHAARIGVIGFDIDPDKITGLEAGRSTVGTVGNKVIERMLGDHRFLPTSDPKALVAADALVICVPTPLDAH